MCYYWQLPNFKSSLEWLMQYILLGCEANRKSNPTQEADYIVKAGFYSLTRIPDDDNWQACTLMGRVEIYLWWENRLHSLEMLRFIRWCPNIFLPISIILSALSLQRFIFELISKRYYLSKFLMWTLVLQQERTNLSLC